MGIEKRRRVLIVGFVLIIFMGVVAAADLSVRSSVANVDLGEMITVQVYVSDVVYLVGAEFDVQYDDSKLEFVGVVASNFLASGGSQVFDAGPYASGNGLVDQYGIVLHSPFSGVGEGAGSGGVVAEVEFRALTRDEGSTGGNANVMLSNNLLLNSEVNEIASAASGVDIFVSWREDVNLDGIINLQDLGAVGMEVGTIGCTNPDCNERANVNRDAQGIVNLQDLGAVGMEVGQIYRAP